MSDLLNEALYNIRVADVLLRELRKLDRQYMLLERSTVITVL